LGADAKTLDGLNPSAAMIDELHAHPDSSVWDVIRSAVGSRRQPLIFAITTAGFNQQCFCFQQRDYAIKVLEGVIEDDSIFAIIYTLDEGDDWHDEKVWSKANPNLNVSVDIKDMRDMALEASESPEKLNNFLCKKLNVWTTQQVKWINPDRWALNNGTFDVEDVIGEKCFAALDLSSNTDISSWGLLFPREDRWLFIPKFYIPKDNAMKRERRDRVPYLTWAEQGWITLTPGNVIDYATIQADIYRDFELYDIELMAFDRWNFEAIRQRLCGEGIPESKMFAFGQGWASMSAPMKELEKIYLLGQLAHNNNPIMNWMASNVAAKTDPAGNIKPDKDKSTEKIDGIVTLIMALGLAITKPITPPSVYEERGVLSF